MGKRALSPGLIIPGRVRPSKHLPFLGASRTMQMSLVTHTIMLEMAPMTRFLGLFSNLCQAPWQIQDSH